MRKVYVSKGEQVTHHLPFSEVAMHMRIAGKPMHCIMLDRGMVQLFDLQGDRFSFPITAGEAGFFTDENGFYFYEAEDVSETKCVHGTDADNETCRECARIVHSRFVVFDDEGELAAFDKKEIARYWLDELNPDVSGTIYDRVTGESF